MIINLIKTVKNADIRRYSATALFFLLFVCFHIKANAQTGVFTLNGGTASETNQTYAATLTDQSAVYVLNSGQLTLTNCTMTKTGDASNVNNSSQYGTNAGVLATTSSTITITGGSVTTNASGANGIFANGSGTSINMSNATISASGSNSHGVDVTYGGSITLDNVNITTAGSSSSALATDFGGGTVTVTGGTIIASDTASGGHSAGIYSTGTITVTGATVSSSGDCGGVIDGANSIILTNTALTGVAEGIKLWKTAPANGPATVTITGGSLTATTGDAFYVTGEAGNAATANVTMSGGATVTAGTGNIMNVIISSTGSFTASGDILTGNFTADATSTLSITLQDSTSLTGNAQNAGITIDATSTWNVTANSVMTTVVDPSGISGRSVKNIIGNGHNVHYDSTLAGNQYLGGLTYSLVDGGYLTPGIVTGIEQLQQTAATGEMLLQNFPDPFTLTTIISYNLFQNDNVTLKVYNQLGNQVEVLVNEYQEAGLYKVSFNAQDLPDGLYYYCLSAGNIVQTKKMVKSEGVRGWRCEG